ncbi:hypothetical protein QBC32DRAFT_331293 [Pseudoneurospora amorphoporcata]|uniref:HMG box domain-containing protein n=1 Tax=Pseudoneurospora amorphoporcata TaxID=241081 RepID=A0AAN6P4S3_9PEZI|nr:hypothetical protein QBC32DRAFT_331293 [Pseudoneurospora amorphoporcata]
MLSKIALATACQLRAGTTLAVRTAAATSVVFQQRGYALTRAKKDAAESDDTAATATKTKKSTRSTTAAKSKKPAAKAAKGAAAKTKKPAAKKEAAPKKKPGPPRKKVVLTEEQKLKLKIKLLKERALLKEEPSTHHNGAWNLYLGDHLKQMGQKGDDADARREYFSKAAAGYKALSAAEKDRYESRADKAHEEALAARAAWVLTKTPLEIQAANYARKHLKRLGAIPVARLIPDDRVPKRTRSSFSWFIMSRKKAGAFQAGTAPTEVMRALGQEWKSMDDAAKQPYIDNCAVDMERYHSEAAATASQYAAKA